MCGKKERKGYSGKKTICIFITILTTIAVYEYLDLFPVAKGVLLVKK